MANGATAPSPGLSFPRATFAKLTPGPFLHAHLKQSDPTRPNGRRPDDSRDVVINTGSLTHSNGSAVVRLGDTAVVCGVRGEILLASDIPNGPKDDEDHDDLLQQLGLLIPNLELSTGCSPAHLPGNPPSGLAQALTWRIYSLLHASNLVNLEDLSIRYMPPSLVDSEDEEGPEIVTKAYWALYIDILCISLDGNCFDAAWIALLAALQNTKLPNAEWDADRETILCSPHTSDARTLTLKDSPVAATFAAFSTASPLKQPEISESWTVADPDAFEEEVCREFVTVTVAGKRLIRIEKSGGPAVNGERLSRLIKLAGERQAQVLGVLSGS